MERVNEGEPGRIAEVWVHDRGGPLRQRGTVVIEDLRDVLTSMASPTGANGPQSPVTQYILAEAAEYLADRLMDDAVGRDGREVPRILSGSLGHQPFIEQVLGMSQHQMLRRWPLATDWYTDVINYVMRPGRFQATYENAADQLELWATGTFGEFVRHFTSSVFAMQDNPKVIRVAEALQSLWPEFEPVKNAMDSYRRQVNELWVPMYLASMDHYGLKLHEGVEIRHLAWAVNALQARETLERLANPDLETPLDADGHAWSYTARIGLLTLAGSVTDLEGRSLSPSELKHRLPVSQQS